MGQYYSCRRRLRNFTQIFQINAIVLKIFKLRKCVGSIQRLFDALDSTLMPSEPGVPLLILCTVCTLYKINAFIQIFGHLGRPTGYQVENGAETTVTRANGSRKNWFHE